MPHFGYREAVKNYTADDKRLPTEHYYQAVAACAAATLGVNTNARPSQYFRNSRPTQICSLRHHSGAGSSGTVRMWRLPLHYCRRSRWWQALTLLRSTGSTGHLWSRTPTYCALHGMQPCLYLRRLAFQITIQARSEETLKRGRMWLYRFGSKLEKRCVVICANNIRQLGNNFRHNQQPPQLWTAKMSNLLWPPALRRGSGL